MQTYREGRGEASRTLFPGFLGEKIEGKRTILETSRGKREMELVHCAEKERKCWKRTSRDSNESAASSVSCRYIREHRCEKVYRAVGQRM